MENDRSFLKYKRYYNYIEPFFKNSVVKTYTGLILSVFTIAFFIAFAIRPTIKTIISLNKQIEDGKYTDSQLQEKINALSIAQGELNAVKNDLPIIFTSLPDNPTIPKFLNLMERGALASTIMINSFQMQGVNLKSSTGVQTTDQVLGVKEIDFSLNLDGSYKNFLSFLEMSRKFRRLVNIEKILLEKSREKNDSGLSLSIEGKVFYYNK